MLTLVGDMLNWIAAGIIFPLMFLPLAELLRPEKASDRPLFFYNMAGIWFAIVAALTAAGVVFAWLVPSLSASGVTPRLVAFAAFVLPIAFLIALIGRHRNPSELLTPIFEAVTRATGRAVMWFLLAMAFIQFAVVVLRYVFGVNFIFMQESITYMHGAVFLLAAGYAMLTDDHVRVDIFYREAPAKRKALVNFLGAYILLFPVCLVLLWTASPYVGNSWAVQEGSTETSGIQGIFIIKSFIPAFAVLLAMAGFNLAAKAGAELKAAR